jgi:hypothetical protein
VKFDQDPLPTTAQVPPQNHRINQFLLASEREGYQHKIRWWAKIFAGIGLVAVVWAWWGRPNQTSPPPKQGLDVLATKIQSQNEAKTSLDALISTETMLPNSAAQPSVSAVQTSASPVSSGAPAILGHLFPNVENALELEVVNTKSDRRAPWLVLREMPTQYSTQMARLRDGTRVKEIGRTGRWIRVYVNSGDHQGMTGYCYQKYLRIPRKKSKTARIKTSKSEP